MKAEHMICWSKTAAEIQDDYAAMAEENEQLRALLRRGVRQLEAWQEFYGRHCNGPTMGNVLPPAGDVRWAEDVSEALATPNVELTGVPPTDATKGE